MGGIVARVITGSSMRRHGGGIRRRRDVAVSICAVGLTVLSLAACSSGNSQKSASNGAKQAVSAADLATFKANYEQSQQVPVFKSPGEPITNPGSLRGAKLMVIPVTSKLPICENIAKQIASLMPELGMTGKVWDNEGQPSQWASGVQAAIQGGYKAITFTCGVDPKAVAPQLEQAKKAGIIVTVSNGADASVSEVSPLLYGITTATQAKYESDNVETAFVQLDGLAHDALVVTSNENAQAPPVVKAIQAKYQTLCGSACGVTVTNVAIPDWSTKIQSSVQAALVANPKIKAIYCVFADQILYALPAVQAAHRSDVHIYTYGGDTAPIKAAMTNKALAANWTASQAWTGYQTVYQTLRGMVGMPPLAPADAAIPYRNITPNNAGEYFSADGGIGTDFVNGYRALFGQAPLSGSALAEAALAGR